MEGITYLVGAKKMCGEFVRVHAREHSIIVDEPTEKGGTNAGMNPGELFLASVVSFLTLTISIYAEAMGVKAENIEVLAEGDLNSAGMRGSANVRPGFHQIRLHVSAQTDTEPDVFQQVVDLAFQRCPVQDSIRYGGDVKKPTVNITNLSNK